MTPSNPSEIPHSVAAGAFGAWLRAARRSLVSDEGAEVPCGDCVGCCVSSYSVQLRPADRRAREQIPAERLVQARGFPADHLTMPALPDGTCPMLHAGRCSIYAVRPQTCIDYDCRIFAAAGIDAGGDDKWVINKRVREWRFSYPTERDRLEHDAVRRAARFVRECHASFPVRVPGAPMGIAVFAIKAYSVFLDACIEQHSEAEIARAMLAAIREFDAEPPST